MLRLTPQGWRTVITGAAAAGALVLALPLTADAATTPTTPTIWPIAAEWQPGTPLPTTVAVDPSNPVSELSRRRPVHWLRLDGRATPVSDRHLAAWRPNPDDYAGHGNPQRCGLGQPARDPRLPHLELQLVLRQGPWLSVGQCGPGLHHRRWD